MSALRPQSVEAGRRPAFRDMLESTPVRLTVAAVLGLVLLRLPLFVWGDSFFNLVLGREVAQAGPITSNRTTAVAFGAPVVDVQWLAHWVFYVAALPAGVAGLTFGGAVWVVLALVAAVVFAWTAGATPGRILLGTLCAFMVLGAQVVLRAQTLVYPWLVLVPAVLWFDNRRPTRHVWWLIPATVLWANLHGSVLLAPVFAGASLVGRQLDRWRQKAPLNAAMAARDALLVVLLAAAILVTPYGPGVWRYYAATAGSAMFRDYITEWYPLWATRDPGGIALLLALAIACWRARRAVDSYTLLVLGGLSLLFVTSVRHGTPLALAAAALLPRVLDEALGQRLPLDLQTMSPRGTRLVTATAVLLFLTAGPYLAWRQQRIWSPTPLVSRVASTVSPGECLLVDEQQADRLLWFYPQLAGIVAHDVRVETLPVGYLGALGAAYSLIDAPASSAFFRKFHGVLVDRRLHAHLVEHLDQDPAFTRVGDDGTVVFFRHQGPLQGPSACTARWNAGMA